MTSLDEAAARVVAAATATGTTFSISESLTGGMVAAAIASVPGASAVFRGAVVAYHQDVKISVLGVPSELIAEHGTVHGEVAAAMARGVATACGAEVAVATTGVAGPGPHEGHPAGTVFVGTYDGAHSEGINVSLTSPGMGRSDVRESASRAALEQLHVLLTLPARQQTAGW